LSRSEIKEILTKCKTIAVVGLSREPYKDSRRVSAYLKKDDFIYACKHFVNEVLGERSYSRLLDIPRESRKTTRCC